MQAHPIPTTHETCNWYPYRSSGELVPPDARMIPLQRYSTASLAEQPR